jgi:hypothetical protein
MDRQLDMYEFFIVSDLQCIIVSKLVLYPDQNFSEAAATGPLRIRVLQYYQNMMEVQ